MTEAQEPSPREAMYYDAVIVGGGPAGLAAAIRLKQVAPDASVVIVEKGSEIGAHIISGAVIDPIGLDKLLPGWRQDPDRPLKTSVTEDKFYLLSASRGVRLPSFLLPPLVSNHGNFVGSLGNVCRYLGVKAEGLGVEIYPGFAAAEVLFGDRGEVLGIATGDMGVGRDGKPKDSFARGMELRGKYTIFAEGARGSLSKQLIARSNWTKAASRKSMASASRSCGRSIRPCIPWDWCSIPSGGRWIPELAAGRSSTISRRIRSSSALWFT